MLLITKVNLLLQQFKSLHAKALVEHDITPRQVTVMMAISEAAEPPSQTVLVCTTGIDRSTVSDILRRIGKKGFVQRTRCKDDARTYQVRLTPEGRQKLKTAIRIMEKVERAGGSNDALASAIDRSLGVQLIAAAE